MRDPLLAILTRMARGHARDRRGWRHRLAGMLFRHYPGLIDCRTFESFLMDYHEGTLAEPSRRRFERHLAMCGLCRASYRGYVRSIELGQRLVRQWGCRRQELRPERLKLLTSNLIQSLTLGCARQFWRSRSALPAAFHHPP